MKHMSSQYQICKATKKNIKEIKIIADANTKMVGFILRPALLEAVERKELLVVKARNNRILGFINYHHRQDQQTTIYEICVKARYRGKGIGRELIKTVANEACILEKDWILLKCPENSPANQFYARVGFCHVSVENGRKRRLNIWKLSLIDRFQIQFLLPISLYKDAK